MLPIPPPTINEIQGPKKNDLSVKTVPTVVADQSATFDPNVILKRPNPVFEAPHSARGRQATENTGVQYQGTLDGSASTKSSSQPAAQVQISGKPGATAALDFAKGATQTDEHTQLLAQLLQHPQTAKASPQQQSILNANLAANAQLAAFLAPLAQAPKEALQALRQQMKQSPAFVFRQLAEQLAPAELAHEGSVASAQEGGAKPATVSVEQLFQQAQSLSAQSPEVQDALKLLVNGQFLWQGMLTPGVPGRISREDAWSTDAEHPDKPLQKGTHLSIELNLPKLGVLKVSALQIGDTVSVNLKPDVLGHAVVQAGLPQLQKRLDGLNVRGVKANLS